MNHITNLRKPDAEQRMRQKLHRWGLTGPPAIVSRRVLRRLRMIRELVTPRVSAACFGTLWNRWTTHRRFQRRHFESNVCVLGCGGEAEDSLEHYAFCQAVRQVADKTLRIDIISEGTKDWMFLNSAGVDDADTMVCTALLVYAVYNATNHYRGAGAATTAVAVDSLKHHLKNVVNGHASNSELLDNRWADTRAAKRRRQ